MTDSNRTRARARRPAGGGLGGADREPGGWLADEVELELRPGGDASFRIGDEVRTGWVEEVRAPAGATPAGWPSGGRTTASPPRASS